MNKTAKICIAVAGTAAVAAIGIAAVILSGTGRDNNNATNSVHPGFTGTANSAPQHFVSINHPMPKQEGAMCAWHALWWMGVSTGVVSRNSSPNHLLALYLDREPTAQDKGTYRRLDEIITTVKYYLHADFVDHNIQANTPEILEQFIYGTVNACGPSILNIGNHYVVVSEVRNNGEFRTFTIKNSLGNPPPGDGAPLMFRQGEVSARQYCADMFRQPSLTENGKRGVFTQMVSLKPRR